MAGRLHPATGMHVTKARVGFVMAWSWLCFGCHGAHFGHIGLGHIGHIGHIGSIAPHIAAAAPRVAPIVVSFPQSDRIVTPSPGPPPPEPVQRARCTSIAPMPELPGDALALPTAICGRHVIVQDADTGLWREHR